MSAGWEEERWRRFRWGQRMREVERKRREERKMEGIRRSETRLGPVAARPAGAGEACDDIAQTAHLGNRGHLRARGLGEAVDITQRCCCRRNNSIFNMLLHRRHHLRLRWLGAEGSRWARTSAPMWMT